MARYRLPDALGGMELPEDTGGVLDTVQNVEAVWLLRFDIPGVGRIRIQQEALEELPEPLPPEPPVGSVVLFGGEAVQRFEDPVEHRQNDEEGQPWAGVGAVDRYTWKQLCSINNGGPVLLVTDPLAGAPELPWRIFQPPTGHATEVSTDEEGYIVDVVSEAIDHRAFIKYDPAEARAKGLALLKAVALQEAAPLDHQPSATARPRSCPTCHSPVQVRLGPFDDQTCTDTWHDVVVGRATTPEVARPTN